MPLAVVAALSFEANDAIIHGSHWIDGLTTFDTETGVTEIIGPLLNNTALTFDKQKNSGR